MNSVQRISIKIQEGTQGDSNRVKCSQRRLHKYFMVQYATKRDDTISTTGIGFSIYLFIDHGL